MAKERLASTVHMKRIWRFEMTTNSMLLSKVVYCMKRQSPVGFQNSGHMLKSDSLSNIIYRLL